MRCLHEADLHMFNCFITLTYADAYLPENGSLRKEDFQNFMKNVRREFPKDVIRYFHCGEYGEDKGRPHYHALMFGLDFFDKYEIEKSKSGSRQWMSPTLDRLWKKGRSVIGEVNFESAAYVARYVMKKVLGTSVDALELYMEKYGMVKKPEYTTMSRRPGIGGNWIKKWYKDTYPDDTVIIRGKEVKPPRFYDEYLKEVDPGMFEEVVHERKLSVNYKFSAARRLFGAPNAAIDDERLPVKDIVKQSRLRSYVRDFEL
jgi:hypothetical protein